MVLNFGLLIFGIHEENSVCRVIPMVFQDGENFDNLVKLTIQYQFYARQRHKLENEIKNFANSNQSTRVSDVKYEESKEIVVANGVSFKIAKMDVTVGSEDLKRKAKEALLRYKTVCVVEQEKNREVMQLQMKISPAFALISYRRSPFINAITTSFREEELIILVDSKFSQEELKDLCLKWDKVGDDGIDGILKAMADELKVFYEELLDTMVRIGLLNADLSIVNLMDCGGGFLELFETQTMTDRIFAYLFERSNTDKIRDTIQWYQESIAPRQDPIQYQQKKMRGKDRPLQPQPEKKPLRQPVSADFPGRLWEPIANDDGFAKIERVERPEWLIRQKYNRVIIPPKSHHHALDAKHKADRNRLLGVWDSETEKRLLENIQSESAKWEHAYPCKNGDPRMKVTLENGLIVILQLTSDDVLTFVSQYAGN